MKKVLTFLAAAAFALTGIAKTESRNDSRILPGAPKSTVRLTDVKDCKQFANPFAEKQKVRKAPAKKTDENTSTVTLKFPMLDEEWSMAWLSVHVYNAEGYYEEFDIERWDEEWNELQIDSYDIQLPEGNYDFFSIFEKVDPDNLFGRSHLYYNIIEDQTVKEGSVVEFKPWECTVRIAMEPTIPNGEKARFREIRYLDENYSWEIIEEGNIADAGLEQCVYYNGECINDLSTNGGGIVVEPGPCGYFNAYDNCNYYVNPVSDKYMFKQLWVMSAWPDVENGVYVTVTQCRGAKEGVYTNSEYTLDEQTLAASKSAEQYPAVGSYGDPAYPYGISVTNYSNEEGMSWLGKGLQSMYPYLWKIWSSKPANEYAEGELYYVYQRSLDDMSIPHEYDWGTWYEPAGVTSAYTFPFAEEGAMTVASPMGEFGAYPQGDKEISVPFPGPEAFAALDDDIDIQVGSSAPLLTFTKRKAFDWETESLIDFFQYGYYGRLDESLTGAVSLASIMLTVNDEEVASNSDETVDWMLANVDTKGEYCFYVSTDEFEIDGIEGGNRAMVVYDTTKEDNTPPAVTMLQMRDLNGKVKQVFKNPAEGEIFISAADIEINEGDVNRYGSISTWFTLSEPKVVSASCVPTGSVAEAINEIALEVMEDTNDGYGFGTVYTGSLKDVDLTSETGWYDLTIMVADEAGNMQVQTLSPAFKIESLATGVAATSIDRNGIKVSGNNITAPEGSRIFNVNGIEVNGSIVASGIYIVKTPSKTVKISVK